EQLVVIVWENLLALKSGELDRGGCIDNYEVIIKIAPSARGFPSFRGEMRSDRFTPLRKYVPIRCKRQRHGGSESANAREAPLADRGRQNCCIGDTGKFGRRELMRACVGPCIQFIEADPARWTTRHHWPDCGLCQGALKSGKGLYDLRRMGG